MGKSKKREKVEATGTADRMGPQEALAFLQTNLMERTRFIIQSEALILRSVELGSPEISFFPKNKMQRKLLYAICGTFLDIASNNLDTRSIFSSPRPAWHVLAPIWLGAMRRLQQVQF